MCRLNVLFPMFAVVSAVFTVCEGQVVTVTMEPAVLSADQGSEGTILCSYTLTDNGYTWVFVEWRKGTVNDTHDTATVIAVDVNNGQTPYYPGGGSKYSMSTDSIATSSLLTVSSVQFTSDEGSYWCRAEFSKSKSPNGNDVGLTQVTVIVLPQTQIFSDNSKTYNNNGDTASVRDGQNHDFTCEVPGINPGALFNWTVGNRAVGIVAGTVDVIGADSLTTSTSVATLEPKNSYHGELLTCKAFNKDGHDGLSASVTLNVTDGLSGAATAGITIGCVVGVALMGGINRVLLQQGRWL